VRNLYKNKLRNIIVFITQRRASTPVPLDKNTNLYCTIQRLRSV